MAGHSAWKNIRHKKAAIDARRGKAWSKCARAIIVAARNGGGDPDSNLSLRYAVDEARSHNMPRDTIDKAIKKGTGELGGASYESTIFEGYGPGGVALMLDILTDNRNRTPPEIRAIFEKHGGRLGSTGCVAYLFQTRGEILVPRTADNENAIMSAALEAGALDVTAEGESWRLVTEPTQLMAIRKTLEAAGIKVASAQLTRIPANTVTVTGDEARKVLALVDALEDHDDVQKVHANFEVPDEILYSDVIRYTVIFQGHVQGVGFRYTACAIARGHAVAGYVKNLPDRRVELIAEGEEADLDAFMEGLKQTMGQFIRDQQMARGPATGQFGTPAPGALKVAF